MFNSIHHKNLSSLAVAGTATLVSPATCGRGLFSRNCQIRSLSCKSFQNPARNKNKIMQNKANFKNSKNDITPCIRRRYESFQSFFHPKNKAKQTQNEPNFRPKLALFSRILALFYKEIFAFANNLNLFADFKKEHIKMLCGRGRFYGKSSLFEEKSFENTQVSEINPCPPVASRRPRGLGAEGPRLLAGQSVKSVSKIISAFSVNSAVKKSAEIRGYIFRVFSCDFVVEKNKIPAVKQEGKYVKMKKGKIPGVEFNLLIPYWHPDFSSALRNRGKLH